MSAFKNLTVFTTGQVASICQVAPRTVTKWFDSGTLKGYRIPGSQDRRIPRKNLIEFMDAHGIPTDVFVNDSREAILCIQLDNVIVNSLIAELEGAFQVLAADTAFQAGTLAMKLRPKCVLVAVTEDDQAVELVTEGIRDLLGNETRMIGLSNSPESAESVSQLLDDVVVRPVSPHQLASRILSQLAIAT